MIVVAVPTGTDQWPQMRVQTFTEWPASLRPLYEISGKLIETHCLVSLSSFVNMGKIIVSRNQTLKWVANNRERCIFFII